MKVLIEKNLRNDEKEGKRSPLGSGRLDDYVASHDQSGGRGMRRKRFAEEGRGRSSEGGGSRIGGCGT